jgi:hypothetical protein
MGDPFESARVNAELITIALTILGVVAVVVLIAAPIAIIRRLRLREPINSGW